jgi:hypothetical protein
LTHSPASMLSCDSRAPDTSACYPPLQPHDNRRCLLFKPTLACSLLSLRRLISYDHRRLLHILNKIRLTNLGQIISVQPLESLAAWPDLSPFLPTIRLSWTEICLAPKSKGLPLLLFLPAFPNISSCTQHAIGCGSYDLRLHNIRTNGRDAERVCRRRLCSTKQQ